MKKRKENQDKVQNLQPKIIESSSTILPSCLYLYLVYQPSKNNKVYHKTNPLFPTLSLCKTIFHPDEQSEACSISFRTVQKKIRQKARSFLDLLSNLLQAQH